MTRLLLGICVHLLVCVIPAFAQSNQSEPPILVIGTQHAPPFAMKLADGSWDGVSVELWREIASDNNWDFEFLEMEPGDLIAATQRGDVDAAVAATAVTSERERVLDFSHPFYSSGLGIAVRKAYRQDWGVDLIQLLARQFLSLLAFFITVTVCIGGFMWLAERQHNPDHFGGVLDGLGHGIWWAVVTMTTVGYGDKTPRTLAGRVLAVFWMLIGVVSLTIVTGSIAAQMTVLQLDSPIHSPADLSRVRTGTVLHSEGESYLRMHGYGFQVFPTAQAALHALIHHDIDAVVYDYPTMRYEIHDRFSGLAEVLPVLFQEESHAIAMPPGSELRKPINISLLRIISAPQWKNTEHRHMGR
ncbi:transporter substrate-binding domain-containing protein [Allorhodopirellula heiligendammensis]|uniref:Glutamine-binding periplasmic protein n=1 Tax=Allorhodopirellula heiligendammensis TaxID=2714739 RepID=A0A5C6BW14_9BACT|nr:transporter substrate-binding domain-containing protein [Allorhodopirellula heiligendammensis]TWU16225.1 Glutamine-binding periplasmic protein precursor [Allorhodopirellula heiligendammensis]